MAVGKGAAYKADNVRAARAACNRLRERTPFSQRGIAAMADTRFERERRNMVDTVMAQDAPCVV